LDSRPEERKEMGIINREVERKTIEKGPTVVTVGIEERGTKKKSVGYEICGGKTNTVRINNERY